MSGTGEPDRFLRQFERDGAIACVAMAAIALVVERGRPDGAAGVLAGGALSALSYWAIKCGVDVVLTGGRRVWLALKFLTRYALLAVGAYVMLACFRVHPVGLLAGATAPFVAAAVQVMRSSRASSGGGHP